MWNFLDENHFDSFKHQNAIAVKTRDVVLHSLTWKEVLEASEEISNFLLEHVTKNHCCIGLLMSHNIYVPSLILSLQKLRHSFMFLSSDSFEDSVEELGIEWILSPDISKFKHEVYKRFKLRGADEFWLIHTGKEGSAYKDISYIIQTSGTTGESKYVQVQENCIRNNIESLSVLWRSTPKDVIFFGTPLTFDPSMVELFLALNTGAALLIVPPRIKINPKLLYETLFPQVTMLQVVPSLFLRWSQEQIKNILTCSTLRILAFGGEEFPNHVLNNEKSKHLRVFNLYGITEMSCWATLHEVTDDASCEVPLGKPIGDTIIEVRSADDEVVEKGEGEIFIGSHSRVCLVKNEPNPPPLFRPTGDLGKINDKSIYYLTRKNNVIKRFGHKINLIKTEETILKLTGLQNKCVWLRNKSKLLCFVLVDNLENASKVLDKIRIKLLHALAECSYPDFIELLVKFPITSHGKIDRNALENVYVNRQKFDKRGADEAFEMLTCKYLGLNGSQFQEFACCNFFELGGNSVLGIQLLAELSDVLSCEYPPELVEALFEKDLRSCLDCLKKCNLRRKAQGDEMKSYDTVVVKRIKSDVQLEIAWCYDFKACVDSSPLVFESSNGRVLVAAGSFSCIFAVLDAENGDEIAKFVLPDAIESAPLVSPDSTYLYVGCFDGNLYCLDFVNGRITWTYSTGDRIKCTPSSCRNSTAIVFGSYDKHLHCVETCGGNGLWKTDVSESIVSRPVVKNGQIYVATIFGTCLCLSEENGSISWTIKTTSPIFGSPCLLEDSVVWPNVQGILTCVSLQGTKLWNLPIGGLLYSSVLHHAGHAIIGSTDGNLYFVNLTSRVTSKANLGSSISSSPSLWSNNGKEFVVSATNSGSVFVIEFDSKSVVCELELGAEVFSSPAVFKDIYVGCRDNRLCCIKRL